MILTPQEAAPLLGYDTLDGMPVRVTSILLPAIDSFIQNATGKDWAADTTINGTAKMVASILLVRWFDNPGQIGVQLKPTDPLVVSMTQLHAKYLQDALALQGGAV